MADYPQCDNCFFFLQDERRCQKHAFIMPHIDWQLLCRDWKHAGKKLKVRLDADILYYYSYGSGKIVSSPVARFDQLQNMVVSVSLRRDDELGWVIFPRQHTEYFPEPGAPMTIYVNGLEYTFHAVNAARNVAAAMSAMGSNVWEMNYHEQYLYMLHNFEEPDLLYHWANQLMDFDAYVRSSFKPSLFAFMEVIVPGEVYALHPDLLAYKAYMR